MGFPAEHQGVSPNRDRSQLFGTEPTAAPATTNVDVASANEPTLKKRRDQTPSVTGKVEKSKGFLPACEA